MNKIKEVTDFIYHRFPYDNNWLNQNCYYFALILKDRFPEGTIVYDVVEGHFMLRIDRYYFDWHGSYTFIDESPFIEWDTFDEYDTLQKERIIRDCIL